MRKTCHISGDSDEAANMLRFVFSPIDAAPSGTTSGDAAGETANETAYPGGQLTPDLAEKLPGEDIWLINRRAYVEALAAQADINAPDDLAARVEALLRQQLASLLSLAKKAGDLVSGFGKTEAGLKSARICLLIAASDGAADGRRKLEARAKAMGIGQCALLNTEELGMALGQSNVIHAGLTDVGWAERIERAGARLAAYLGDTGQEKCE